MQLIEGMVRLVLEKRRWDSAEMAKERAQEEAASTQLSDETERLGRQLEDHRLCMMRLPMEARKNYRDTWMRPLLSQLTELSEMPRERAHKEASLTLLRDLHERLGRQLEEHKEKMNCPYEVMRPLLLQLFELSQKISALEAQLKGEGLTV
jgi:hypothetical protein